MKWSPDTEDDTLIAAAGAGSLDAFAVLVQRYQAAIRAFTAVRLDNAADAEDLAQEAFIVAWRKIKTFEPGSYFGAWLRAIALNLVLNYRRKFRAHGIGGHAELEALLEDQHEALDATATSRLIALEECLSKVDGPSQKLLRQRYAEGRTIGQIAAETGRGYSALTMQLHRLRLALASCVEQHVSASQTP